MCYDRLGLSVGCIVLAASECVTPACKTEPSTLLNSIAFFICKPSVHENITLC